MSDQYRLIFAGEVTEGQHPAVVKKRLSALLKVSDEQAQKLFSGKPVVVKKAADRTTAARYQKAFHEAGARLRVTALEQAASAGQAAAEADPAPSAASAAQDLPARDTASHNTSARTESTTSGSSERDPSAGMQALPVGSDILTDAERVAVPDADVDTSHLSVQGAVFFTPDDAPEVAAPSVDHLSMAEPGSRLGPQLEEVEVTIDADFDVADVGAIIGAESPAAAPVVDVDAVDFDLAEPGADIDTQDKPAPPPPPNTDHLGLDDNK